MATEDWVEDDEWELVNDDGFVYKRKKRPRLDPTTSSAPPPPDPAVEEENRRKRRKLALTKVKEKYQKEIDQWEHLSNTLQAMVEKSQIQQQQLEHTAIVTSSPPANSSDFTCRRIIDDLLAQAEGHETIIRDVSNLCDVAEAICNAQEERVKKSFIDLPIWASSSPDLIISLCEERSSL